MSTHAAIIEKLADGTYRGIYCHFDGYLDGVGRTLRDHYADPKRVSALVDLGNISSLGKTLAETDAYARDQGEDVRIVAGQTAAEVANSIGHTGHVYVYTNGEWFHNNARIPPKDVGRPARIVVMDEDGREITSYCQADDDFDVLIEQMGLLR